MTRGRAWIAVLSLLLAGIVALNVASLSLSASQGPVSQQAQVLEQENSALRARLALRLSNQRVENAAATLGMSVPEPGEISYRDSSGRAVQLAARRLAAGFGIGGGLVEALPEATTTTTDTAAAPTTTTATSPTPTTATSTPETPATTTTATAPAQPASPTGSTTGGGVAAG